MAIQTFQFTIRGIARPALLAFLLIGSAVSSTYGLDELRYLVNYTSSPPTIDGTSTSAEWRDAAPAIDQWVMIGSPDNSEFDETNNAFIALWDEQGIYIQHQVSYAEWDERGTTLLDSDYETLEFYFDPNADGESNAQTDPTDTGADGYSLLFNQPFGQSEINHNSKTAGVFAEARANSNSAGIWSGFANMEMAQATSIESASGYMELFLPWADFNATNPLLGFSEELGDDIGLFHPEAPIPGAEWYFNIGRRETGGSRPAWTVASPDATTLATRPHGVLEFMQSGNEIRMCDINRDGTCSAEDIDELTDAIIAGSADTKYDLDSNGDIDLADRRAWIENEEYMFTFLGDSNLDGKFSSRDFVVVFQSAEYEDDLVANSGWADGDWNGDKEFNTRDFVDAFQSAAYEKGTRQMAVNSVPEPRGLLAMLVSCALVIGAVRRRIA